MGRCYCQAEGSARTNVESDCSKRRMLGQERETGQRHERMQREENQG